MNFESINSTLSATAASMGADVQQEMSGDMSDPATWTKVQYAIGQYSNLMQMQSALINDMKSIESSIVQHM